MVSRDVVLVVVHVKRRKIVVVWFCYIEAWLCIIWGWGKLEWLSWWLVTGRWCLAGLGGVGTIGRRRGREEEWRKMFYFYFKIIFFNLIICGLNCLSTTKGSLKSLTEIKILSLNCFKSKLYGQNWLNWNDRDHKIPLPHSIPCIMEDEGICFTAIVARNLCVCIYIACKGSRI